MTDIGSGARNYGLCFHGGMADAALNEHRAVQDALIANGSPGLP